jgi:hypothetical protein
LTRPFFAAISVLRRVSVVAAVVFASCTDSPTAPTARLSHGTLRYGTELQPVEINGCQWGGTYPDCYLPPDSGDPSFPPVDGGGTGCCTGGGGGTTAPQSPSADASDDQGALGVPNCTASTLHATERAWCGGRQPTADELSKIKAALERMRAKGGVCAELAGLGDAYIANTNLHMINDQAAYWDDFENRNVQMGGAAPKNGGYSSFIVIGTSFTSSWYDASHMSYEGPGGSESRTLQQLLAHELDHLHGSDHLLNPLDFYRTDNSQHCSDLPGQ